MTCHRGARVGSSAEPPEFELPDSITRGGVLFNTLNRVDPRDHDLQGAIRVGGVTYKLRGWWTPGRNGVRYLKLRVIE